MKMNRRRSVTMRRMGRIAHQCLILRRRVLYLWGMSDDKPPRFVARYPGVLANRRCIDVRESEFGQKYRS